MIFPYGDTNIVGGRFPLVNWMFIGACMLVFGYQLQLQFEVSTEALEAFIYTYGFIPQRGIDVSIITSMFLHGGFAHIFGNLLMLYLFGDNIEQTVGRPTYFVFYLLGGVVATGAQYFANPVSAIPNIGASGAIAAVMGAYIVLFPRSEIKMLWFFFPFRISAFLFLGFWIVQQFLSGTASLGVPTEDTVGIAWWAHIGGFIYGVLAGLYFKRQRRGAPAYG